MVKNLGARALLIFAVVAVALAVLFVWSPRYGIDLKGGSTLVYRVKAEGLETKDTVVDDVIRIMQKRLDPQGLQASTFRPLGKDQVEIQLAGADKPEVERIKEKLTQLGKLEFRIVAEKDELLQAGINLDTEAGVRQAREQEIEDATKKGLPPPPAYEGPQPERFRFFYYKPNATDVASAKGEFLKMEKGFSVSGEKLAAAYRDTDPQTGNACVGFKLQRDAAQEMGDLTGRNVNRRMAIVLNGFIETAPNIHSQITEGGVITKGAGYDPTELKDLIDVLRAGSLPVKPELLHESTVGPTLGAESISSGIKACLISAVVIVLFMLVYYRLAGLVANVAILLNLVLLVAIMVAFGWTFTLPGIAGIVLTLGMQVDANILINERIREEREKGKTLLQAIKNAFDRVTITILDTNLTTILAAVILWLVGTGPIQGFATTMTVGILVSMFTALFVTKTFFAFLAEGGLVKDLTMMRILKKPNFDYFRIQRPALAVSVVFVSLSLLVFFMRGPEKYGLDFTGGVVIQMELKEPRKTGEIRTALASLRSVDETGTEKPKYPDAEVSAVGAAGQTLEKSESAHFEIRSQILPRPGEDENAIVREFQRDLEEAFSDLLVPKGFVPRPRVPLDSADPALRDFVGAHQFELGVQGRTDPAIIARVLSEAHFSPTPLVTAITLGDSFSRFVVVAKPPSQVQTDADLPALVTTALTRHGLRVLDPFPLVETTGPTVVKDLKNKAIIAMVLALIAMTVYIRIRFKNMNWGVAASLCLFHDVIIALGFLVFFDSVGLIHARIDLDAIAAFLTIVGYQINDTIVIFDRVRENLGKLKGSLREIINTSVNETLGRSILTSLTVLMVVTVLFVVNYGQQSKLEGLSFALIIGTIFGSYSSIYIAGPIAMALESYSQRRRAIIAEAEQTAANAPPPPKTKARPA